ncbi:MAG: flippase-like domain-containing protein [Acidimicrobiia bacterium]|nr:flippase-like domain-containing protein [Acidimicrobiia bacterium]
MTRRHLLTAARLLASFGMLAFLLTKVTNFNLSELLPAWHASTFAWLLSGLALTLFAVVVAAMRWQLVAGVLHLHARLRTFFSQYLAGMFVSSVLPSTIGGDVVRVSRLSATTGDPPGSFASVILERISGWVILPLLTFAGLAIHPSLLNLGDASKIALLLAVGALVVLAILVAAGISPKLGGRLAHNEGWTRFLGAVHLGMEQFRRAPLSVATVLGVSLAYQLTLVVAAWMIGHALGLNIGITVLLAFLPAVAMAQVLPISIGGLGLREGALVLFLHPLGVSYEHAIAFGLLIYAMNLVVSLLGAPAFAVGSGRRPVEQAPAQAQAA